MNPQRIVCRRGRDGFPGDLFVDGMQVTPSTSQRVRNHSPDGFSWGYGGSGPAQLALAILLHVSEDVDMAQRHYQDFKSEHVAAWPQDDDVDVELDVEAWLAAREALANRNGAL